MHNMVQSRLSLHRISFAFEFESLGLQGVCAPRRLPGAVAAVSRITACGAHAGSLHAPVVQRTADQHTAGGHTDIAAFDYFWVGGSMAQDFVRRTTLLLTSRTMSLYHRTRVLCPETRRVTAFFVLCRRCRAHSASYGTFHEGPGDGRSMENLLCSHCSKHGLQSGDNTPWWNIPTRGKFRWIRTGDDVNMTFNWASGALDCGNCPRMFGFPRCRDMFCTG